MDYLNIGSPVSEPSTDAIGLNIGATHVGFRPDGREIETLNKMLGWGLLKILKLWPY